MRAFLYVACLLLSLPNLIAGLALLLLRNTVATLRPLEIVTNFLFGIVWGIPLAAALFLVLFVFGILTTTRPYTALFAFILNVAALGFVLWRFGLPNNLDHGIFFVPVILALAGFSWLAFPVSQSRRLRDSG